jgi:hypothetical protein
MQFVAVLCRTPHAQVQQVALFHRKNQIETFEVFTLNQSRPELGEVIVPAYRVFLCTDVYRFTGIEVMCGR